MSTTLRTQGIGHKFAHDHLLETTTCTCGVIFAIPERLLKQRREDGETLYCPLGHHLVFNQGRTKLQLTEDALQRERDAAGRLASRLEQTEASRTAYKAAATRARNEKARLIARVANGVCPCCNRTFSQLARHMVAKHPEFVDESQAKVEPS